MRSRVALASLFVLSLATGGCYSKVTAYNGNFTLGYASGVQIENFVKPIAPGAKLDVVVFANGTARRLEVTKAVSTKPTVLTIDKIKDKEITLKAGEPGVAEIEVTAKNENGDVLVDKMFFHVGKPTSHKIEHACTEQPNAAYVRGEDIDVFHNLATSDNRAVIGYDYAPVTIEPKSAMTLTEQPQGAALYVFRAKQANERVTLKSTVDGKALTFRIVDKKDLKDGELHGPDRLVEGGSQYAVADVTFGSLPLCNQNALTKARSLTPDICSVTANLDDEPDEDDNHWQLALIKGLKFGTCKYEVTLPELNQGRGLVLRGEAKVGRVEFPRDGQAKGSFLNALETRTLLLGVAARDTVAGLAWLGLLGWRRRKKTR